MNFLSVTGLVVCLSSVVCALLVLLSRPINTVKFCWVLFTAAVAVWGFGFFQGFYVTDQAAALFWFRFLNISAIFVPLFFLQFSLFFCGRQKGRIKILLLNYLFSAGYAAVALVFPETFISGTVARFSLMHYPAAGLSYWFFPLIYTFQWGYGTYLLYKKFVSSAGNVREQAKYTLLGVGLAYVGGGSTFLGVVGFNFYPYPIALVPFYVILISYAIVRYRLMDIRVVVASTGIFFFVYAVTLGVPFYIQSAGANNYALISMAILASIGPFLYNRLKQQAEDKILSAERADQEVLLSASRGLNKHKTVEEIVKFICFILGRILKVRSAAFYLNDGDRLILNDASLNGAGFPKEMPAGHPLVGFFRLFNQPHNIDELKQTHRILAVPEITEFIQRVPAHLAMPIIRNDVLIGLILLGERGEDLRYSTRDMDVLGVISDQVALAVENAGYLEVTKKDFIEVMHDRRLKDIGILGSTISHQMCNRLQRVTMGVGLFEANFNEEALAHDSREELVAKLRETSEDMKVIGRNAVSAAAIADALKTFSKSGADAAVVLLQRLVRIARDLTDAKHRHFVYDFIQEVPEDLKLYVNEPSIQDVFLNAFDNGLDAIKMRMNSSLPLPEGFKPKITVRARKQGPAALIEIEDNGIGFKPEDKDKLFIPFFTTKGSDKGTGLGLHAMRELVRRNGGMISIASEYWRGARVTITLPLADERTNCSAAK